MIQLIVGHRGTGKSFLAKKFSPVYVLDLDQQIEVLTGRSAADWIERSGEAAFRETEKKTLSRLMSEQAGKDVMIVLGAGFELDVFEWPREVAYEIIFWRRPTDSWGRIFTDRPRLNPKLSPLQEYTERSEHREIRFREASTWILEWPEGEHLNDSSQATHLLANSGNMEFATYTLKPKDRERTEFIKSRFFQWKFQAFELRTDLLTDDDLSFWRSQIPAARIVWAERQSPACLSGDPAEPGFLTTDWALELGLPAADYQTLSSHGTDLELFPKDSKANLKWSPLMESWQELWRGYQWQQQDPQHRSFLPRSVTGRWAWFRLLMKGRQPLNFVRETPKGEAPDQPSLLEWMNTTGQPKAFAAVLGDPIQHSWTPGEQAAYFANFQMPVLRIHVAQTEWDEALPILKKMGLKAAAVTAPLKFKAFASCQTLTPNAEELQSVNTMVLALDQWSGDNTDLAGLREALKVENLLHSELPKCIYGGGGTLKMLAALLPEASRFSVRTQSLRPVSPQVPTDGIFIWAAGPRDELPQFEIRPQIVVDLNYRQDSRARELALKFGARYIGGEKMFLSQAAGQRDFWSLHWKGFTT